MDSGKRAYTKRPLIERFMRRISVDKKTGCWIWTASKITTRRPYGRFHINSRPVLAHRWGYEYFKGPIPEGLEIDHLCNQASCVNPEHLKAVTGRENNRRSNSPSALNAKKTHCKYGHEFTAENTYFRNRGSYMGRECRECIRRISRQRKQSPVS